MHQLILQIKLFLQCSREMTLKFYRVCTHLSRLDTTTDKRTSARTDMQRRQRRMVLATQLRMQSEEDTVSHACFNFTRLMIRM